MKTGKQYLVVRLDIEFDFFAGQGADSGCGEHGRVVCLVGEVWECGAVGKWDGSVLDVHSGGTGSCQATGIGK